MIIIEVDIDVHAGTAEVRGMLSNAENARLVLKGYAPYVTDTSRVRVLAQGRTVSTGGDVEVDGDDGVVTLNTNTDAVKKIARCAHGPAQIGVEVVVDDPEGNVIPCSGRGILLLNWIENPRGGGGGTHVDSKSVPITNINDLPARYRDSDVRNKINEIARVISGRAVAIISVFAPFAALCAGLSVFTANKEDVYNDERIVTNVTWSADGLVTDLGPMTNYVDTSVAAAASEAAGKVGAAARAATNYTDAAKSALSASIASARSGAVSDSKAYTDAATNAIAIPTYDLTPYAQKTWVEAKGYLLPSALAPYSTKEWVENKGYVTQSALSQYAQTSWVQSQGYLVQTDLLPYAKESWVNGRGFATTSWVDGRGFASTTVTDSLSSDITRLSDRMDNLARMSVDTNGVTRMWTYDGSAMLDATGVVWDVTWSMVPQYTSLSNGLVYVKSGATTWDSQGVVTNLDGDVGVGVLDSASGMEGQFRFYVKTVPSKAAVSDTFGADLVSFSGEYYMRADAFTNTPVRTPSFTYRNRFAWITEAGGGGSVIESQVNPGWAASADFATRADSADGALQAIFDDEMNYISQTYVRKFLSGQTFDFSDNRVLYTAISNIVIQMGGTVVNFPSFQ